MGAAMTDRELMQQALDVLEKYGGVDQRACDAEEALRDRLAQPESEVDVCCQDFRNCLRSCTPRGQWIAHVRCGCGDQIMPDDDAECGTCVTARNAVKQEPLAQMREMLEVQGRDGTWNCDTYSQGMYNGMEFMVALAEGREPVFREPPERWLHTPPQREWQTLTDDEVKQLWKDTPQLVGVYSYTDISREVEAKLKEKNT